MQMRYELNFDEDKIIDIEAIGDNGVLDLKDCCKIMNEQQDKITELEKNFEDLVDWSTEISKRNVLLDEKIGRLQEEEKLYAQEILRLNELLKQYQSFKDLGGDY
jgi:chromosome segregation ATPase